MMGVDVALEEEQATTGGAAATSTVRLACYTDVDYAADKATRKSISGAILYVGNVRVA